MKILKIVKGSLPVKNTESLVGGVHKIASYRKTK